jgi:putative transposase
VKYGRIDELRQSYPAAAMCRMLGVSESGYHAWRKRPPSSREHANAPLEIEIRAAHERTRHTDGPERLQADLDDNGIQVRVHRIKRLRKKLGLRCKQKRKFKATTDSRHSLPVALSCWGQGPV